MKRQKTSDKNAFHFHGLYDQDLSMTNLARKLDYVLVSLKKGIIALIVTAPTCSNKVIRVMFTLTPSKK